jgi:hypothetical protein
MNRKYMPSAWLMAYAPVLYPKSAAEVLLICSKNGKRKKGKDLRYDEKN